MITLRELCLYFGKIYVITKYTHHDRNGETMTNSIPITIMTTTSEDQLC